MAVVARRTLLRKLALESGVIEKNPKTFMLQADALNDLLRDVFADIEDKEDSELEELIKEYKSANEEDGGDDEEPAPKKKRGRGKAKPKEEEEPEEKAAPKKRRGRGKAKPKEEEVEEVEEKAAPKKRRGRGKAKSKEEEVEEVEEETEEKAKPKGRGRGRGRGAGKTDSKKTPTTRKKAPAKEGKKSDDAPAPPEFDLAPLVERLDTIGPLAAKAKAGAEEAVEKVEAVQKDVNLIVQFLTWQYNETLYDEDGDLLDDDNSPIESIRDTDWSSD